MPGLVHGGLRTMRSHIPMPPSPRSMRVVPRPSLPSTRDGSSRSASTARCIYKWLYKWRHLIENFFCKLKDFRRIALLSDKTDASFIANIYLAAAVLHSR